MCLSSTKTMRLIRERGGGGLEVGREGDYIPIVTLSPPEANMTNGGRLCVLWGGGGGVSIVIILIT